MTRLVNLWKVMVIIIISYALYAATIGPFIRPAAGLADRIYDCVALLFGAGLGWMLGDALPNSDRKNGGGDGE